MSGKAAKVLITERQQEILSAMTRSRGCAQGLAQRAHTILLSFEGWENRDIADLLDCERHGVGIWRRRWQAAFESLIRVECLEEPAAQPLGGRVIRAGCTSACGPNWRSTLARRASKEELAPLLARRAIGMVD